MRRLIEEIEKALEPRVTLFYSTDSSEREASAGNLLMTLDRNVPKMLGVDPSLINIGGDDWEPDECDYCVDAGDPRGPRPGLLPLYDEDDEEVEDEWEECQDCNGTGLDLPNGPRTANYEISIPLSVFIRGELRAIPTTKREVLAFLTHAPKALENFTRIDNAINASATAPGWGNGMELGYVSIGEIKVRAREILAKAPR